ncbi:sensor histidine kinase [Paenibacillus sp. FSL H7-0331]|uniref:sensor histidine kinase n=1 Tax=Paenibacillus sp. FSL H7-0331 TaxID=1920421 RepID=UPI00096F5EE9|nr:sensor histidine kinase [Paenibacillus sp. FSL H7-0331]OMF05908.1 hypothetical protein BK127_31850 [Paenibacillus sp. FSL H7-0331]
MFIFKRLQVKLFVYFLLLVLIPLITLGYFSYTMATRFLEEESVRNQSQTMKLIGNNIKLMLDDAGDITSYITNNESLQHVLGDKASQSLTAKEGASFDYLENIKIAKKYVTFLVIYGENGFLYRDFSEYFRQVIPYTEVMDQPLYVATAARDGRAYWTFSGTSLFTFGHSYNEIMVGRKIVDSYDHDKSLGMLFMGVNRDSIGEIIKDIEIVNSANIFIFDNNYNLVTSKHEDAALKKRLTEDLKLKEKVFQKDHSESYTIGGKDYFVSSTIIEPYEWNIVSFIPLEVIHKQHGILLKVTLLLSLTLLVVVGLISVVLSKSITSPIKILLKSMNNFKRGDFKQKVAVTSQDEIGMLSHKYNEMVMETNELIQKVYVSQTHQKIIELKTLQTQIEPHFLYNTLDFIFLNSKINGDEQTARVVHSLSELFRLSLNKGHDYYTLDQEINQIKAYISIQHARFPKRFTPKYDIDPEAGSYLTMKLLLQPIVENAILHAFNERKNEPGVLIISGRIVDHQIVMVIEDNGCGLSPDKKEHLLNGSASGKQGFGIRNVNERLRMMFGPEHELMIDSKPLVGTKVTLRLPMIESEEQWRLLYENHGH